MLALTVDYVTRTIHQLPNLYTPRTTTSFQGAPAVGCPVHGVARSLGLGMEPAWRGTDSSLGLLQTSLNDVLFSEYHIFRAEAQIADPGESREVALTVPPRALSSVDAQGQRSILAGSYTLSMGSTQPEETQGKSEQGFRVTGTTSPSQVACRRLGTFRAVFPLV